MKEYTIKYTKQNLTLFKTSKSIRFIKKRGFHIEASTTKIDSHFSMLKERLQNYPSTIYAYGIPTKDLFIGRVYHATKEIHFSPVDSIYHFNEKLHSKTHKQPSNFIVKSLSKEDLEHRKKNINYMLKRNENEEALDMRYISDMPVSFNILQPRKKEKLEKNEEHDVLKLRMVILRVKIVNIGELVKVSRLSKESIVDVVSEMCVKMNSRFVLKCKYYPRELKDKRKRILERFINLEEIQCFNASEIELMFINEVCVREGNKYKLKGYKETIELVTKKTDIEKIISENVLIGMEKLTGLVGLEEDEIQDLILENRNIVTLVNKTYVIRKDDNPKDLRNIIIDFLVKQEFLKRSEISQVYFNLTGEEPNIFSYNKIMREFCTNKGNNWVIKNSY